MLKEQESNQKTEVESEKRPKYIPVLVVKNKTPEGIDYLQAIGVDSNGSPVVTNGENIEKLFENCPQPVYYQAAYESGDLLTVEAKPEIGELKPNDIRILGTEYSISSSSKEGGLSKTQIVIGPDTTQDEPEQNIPLKKLIKAMASIDECSDIYYAWLDPDDKNSQPKMIIFGEPQTSFDNWAGDSRTHAIKFAKTLIKHVKAAVEKTGYKYEPVKKRRFLKTITEIDLLDENFEFTSLDDIKDRFSQIQQTFFKEDEDTKIKELTLISRDEVEIAGINFLAERRPFKDGVTQITFVTGNLAVIKDMKLRDPRYQVASYQEGEFLPLTDNRNEVINWVERAKDEIIISRTVDLSQKLSYLKNNRETTILSSASSRLGQIADLALVSRSGQEDLLLIYSKNFDNEAAINATEYKFFKDGGAAETYYGQDVGYLGLPIQNGIRCLAGNFFLLSSDRDFQLFQFFHYKQYRTHIQLYDDFEGKIKGGSTSVITTPGEEEPTFLVSTNKHRVHHISLSDNIKDRFLQLDNAYNYHNLFMQHDIGGRVTLVQSRDDVGGNITGNSCISVLQTSSDYLSRIDQKIAEWDFKGKAKIKRVYPVAEQPDFFAKVHKRGDRTSVKIVGFEPVENGVGTRIFYSNGAVVLVR